MADFTKSEHSEIPKLEILPGETEEESVKRITNILIAQIEEEVLQIIRSKVTTL